MNSLWQQRAEHVTDDPFPEGTLDDVVVGAGLTGLTTALLLARAGRRVAVLEAREIGALTTGRSTAKVSLLQGTKLSEVLQHRSRSVAEAYVEANREGQEWLLRFCDDHDVPVQRRLAATFAAAPQEVSSVRLEHEAATALGLSTSWADSLEVAFPCHGATVLDDQAQLDPMQVLGALVAELRRHGGTLHQGGRVTGVSPGSKPVVSLDDGRQVRAREVVLATGTPILDRGLHFARLEARRSYAMVVAGVTHPEGMYLSAGSDSRSVRSVPAGDGESLLLVGGAGHVVGRTHSEGEHEQRLLGWTERWFPGGTVTHRWSAQDYRSTDGLPVVDRLPGSSVQVASGYDKWGMTNAVAAARCMSGRILGSEPSWAGQLYDRRPALAGAAQLALVNAKVGAAMAGSVVRRLATPVTHAPKPGPDCGRLGACTHLGGLVRWNDAERTWDCPLHGSRFESDGTVIEGPATRPLGSHRGRPEGSGS